MAKLKYGISLIKNKRGEVIGCKKPQMELRHNNSGYGKSKDNPFYIEINGKELKRFNTQDKAVNYFNKYRKKVNKEFRKCEI